MPIAIEPAAVWMACMAEPQKRFTVAPATLRGRPASTPTIRPTFMPCSPSGKAQPIVTSSICAGVDAGALDEGADDLAAELVGPHLARARPCAPARTATGRSRR